MRVALLVSALTAVCNGILPEIVHPGVTHILGDYYGQTEPPELDDESVEVEQRSEDLQPAAEDAAPPVGILGSLLSHLTTEHCIYLQHRLPVCIMITLSFGSIDHRRCRKSENV